MSLKGKLRKKYQYSSLPEIVPVSIKRAIKKLRHPGSNGYGVSYRTNYWVNDMANFDVDSIDRKGFRSISSENIRRSISYGTRARKIDEAIQKVVNKNYYRFEHMLVIKDPFNQAPLTALVIFYSKESCAVRYTVKGKTKQADFSQTLKPTCQHRIPIIGLYAGYENKVEIEILDETGKSIKRRTIVISTKPLPPALEGAVTVGKHSAPSAHPMTLITAGHNIRTIAFDEFGDIRYYLRRLTKAYGVFPLSAGKMLYSEKWIDVPSFSVSQSCFIYDMDYLGRVHKSYLSPHGFHHCAIEKTPGGNILVGSNTMDGHDEDAVMELDRQTGMPVEFINMRQYFEGSKFDKGSDWVHVNAVDYQKDSNTLIVSMR
ncbi:MAG: aryl-sulfate sulfotransferase, partial [Lachnospiraceae bacterium]|nr:aryl-sulfate sulfotransferase [Lachnospiraceae bacterium]